MGLLLSLIGLQSAGVVVKNEDTMVGLGELMTLNVALAVGGLALIAALHHNKIRGSILIGMAFTAIAYFAVLDKWPQRVFALPTMQLFDLDFSSIIKVTLEDQSMLNTLFNSARTSPLRGILPIPTLQMDAGALSAITAYMLVMIFDIGGAMFGLGKLAGIVEGNSVPGSVGRLHLSFLH